LFIKAYLQKPFLEGANIKSATSSKPHIAGITAYSVTFAMQTNAFLLYGANGYTGRLILNLATAYGLQPILAGRNESAIRTLAQQHHLPFRIADVNNPEQLKEMLTGIPLVLHAAGPFKHTAFPMIEACLHTGTHYLDITGEIEVFEKARHYDKAAQEKGIMIMPGVGFDVVPTDCLSLFLKEELPDANYLQLAFTTLGGGVSHGTAVTMAEGLGEGGAVREEGRIVKKPLGHKGHWVNFGPKELFVMTIPWGDVSTAYFTTGIPNIEVYTGIKPGIYKLLKFQPLYNWLLRTNWVRNYIKKRIKERPAGPDEKQRSSSQSMVWGQVQNGEGKRVEASLITPDGYTLTAHSSLLIAKKVLESHIKPGYQTPASVYGADLVLEIQGTARSVKRE
jgi:short subunit dehydrogenase-like uncharacterized protein